MSRNVTSKPDVTSRVAGLIRCPICIETFDRPTSLPCLHVFCFRCLVGSYGRLAAGRRAECAVCRTEFRIPSRGLAGLPHDFKMQELVDAWKEQSPPTTVAAAAADDDDDVETSCGNDIRRRSGDADVVHTSPDAEPVLGIATLDSELFVLRRNAKNTFLEVYPLSNTPRTSVTSQRKQHQIVVPRLGSADDMAACAHFRCLYVADSGTGSIHRVDLAAKVITKWRCDGEPTGLSVTSRFGVLVTCYETRALKEFATDGELLRRIDLEPELANPWHAVQLPGCDRFVVCHGGVNDLRHRVCIVDAAGGVAWSYGGRRGSAPVGQLSVPWRVAVDDSRRVAVVDLSNCRVVLLSATLAYEAEIMSAERLDWWPLRMHLDAARGRLYVAENKLSGEKYTAGRITVVDMSQCAKQSGFSLVGQYTVTSDRAP